jgi:hypothetical protein
VPDLSPISRLLRAGGALMMCAALGPSCLLEFPQRQFETVDAGTPDAGGDLGTIAQDRFDWPLFAAHGLVADPDGRLRTLFFLARTGEDRRVTFSRLTLDDTLAESAPAQLPRARVAGEFELTLPDVGTLRGASIVMTRDDASGLGTVRLVDPPGWGGPIVLTRLVPVEERPGVDGPYTTRLVGVGGEPGAPRAAIGLVTFSTLSFSLVEGLTSDGAPISPAQELDVELESNAQFRVLDMDLEWVLKGAWLPASRLFVAHRLNGIGAAPDGGPVLTLPELWFGLPTPTDPVGPRALAGRWRLAGLRVDDGRWSGFGASLVITSDLADDFRFALRSDPGGVDHDGTVDLPSTEELVFKNDVVSLNPEDDSGDVWFAIGAYEPPFIVLWGMSGQRPLPSLLFGLREN